MRFEHLEIVKLLLENGADVNIQDDNRNTPLIVASRNQHLEIVKYLVDNGANKYVNDKELIKVSMYGELEKVKELIENGVDVNIQDNDGETALMTASTRGHLDIVKYLVKQGANINLKDNDGNTAYLNALDNMHIEIAKCLVQQGTDISYYKQPTTKQNKLTYSGIVHAATKSGLEYVDFGGGTKTWGHVDHVDNKKSVVLLSIYSKPIDVLYTPFMMQGGTTNQANNANFRAWMGTITSQLEMQDIPKDSDGWYEDVLTILYEPDNDTQIYGKDYFIEIMRNKNGSKYLFINQAEHNILLENNMKDGSKLIPNMRYEMVKNNIKKLF